MPDLASRPKRSILVYDGECAFCRLWVERWKSETGERIEYLAYQDTPDPFSGVEHKTFRRGVGYIAKDGTSVFGAAAVFRLYAEGMGNRFWWWCHRTVPGFRIVTEAVYRFVASHRSLMYRVTKLAWGKSSERSTFRIASRLGLRFLGVVFLIAFWSLRDQVVLLVGSGGLLPFAPALQKFHATVGWTAYLHAPTLLWFGMSDQALRGLCTVGAIAAVFVILDILTLPALIVCFACYLSLFTVGQEFMTYQWDLLLIESGFLAILLAIVRRAKPSAANDPARLVQWLFRWLVFRLFFESGLAKITSGDLSWRNLTAVGYHYATQPLPTPLAWSAAHLPLWFQQASTFAVLGIELVVPWFVFAPRKLRHLAVYLLIFLQIAIGLTGNFGFFNLLTIVLCLFLFDDVWYRRVVPKRLLGWLAKDVTRREASVWMRRVMIGIATVLVAFSLSLYVPSVRSVFAPFAPYPLANRYGLFSVMTKQRAEVVIEGSDDGLLWKEYPFAFNVGNDLTKAPVWTWFYLPRFDWQMWFTQFATYKRNSWFLPLMTQLLNGKGFARFLFASNPFPQKPPEYVRAMVYIYRFSPNHEGGVWWTRELKGYYFPPVTLNDLKTL